jgi:LysR family nitrogen assimilation transcriptional regulator
MDLRQLRYFVSIVQSGSLTRAAAHLHVAQSAISQHLARLESELKKQLVIRGLKGIVLTEAGTVLYRHAEAILRHIEFAKQDAMNAAAVPSGRVAIGFPSAVSTLLGHELFLRMRSDYPQIILHLTDGNSSLLRERLDNGRLDIALLFVREPERGLAVESLAAEELFYVSAKLGSRPITMEEAARHPLLLPGPGSGIEKAARDAFRKRGLPMNVIGEIDTMIVLRRAVSSGLANTILPWAALTEENGTRTLHHRSFSDTAFTRPVSICFSEVSHRSPGVEAVAATLRSIVGDLIKERRWRGISLWSDGNHQGLSRKSASPES